MVYKLANVSELSGLPPMDNHTLNILYEFTSILTQEYGANRDVENDDGGYVLYAPPGTPCEEVKSLFNYSVHPIEYVNQDLDALPPLCAAMYILSNEYTVIIVMSIADAPAEITNEFDDNV